MKKFFIAICGVLFLANSVFAAEFLVQAQPHWMDSLTQTEVDKLPSNELRTYKARAQIGDVIIARPDNWLWGKEERLPKYIVVKIPDMTLEEARKYEEGLNKIERCNFHGEIIEIPKDFYDKKDYININIDGMSVHDLKNAQSDLETRYKNIENFSFTSEERQIKIAEEKETLVPVMAKVRSVSFDYDEEYLLRVRKYSFSPSQIKIAVSGGLNFIQINKATADGYTSIKTGNPSEISSPKNDTLSRLDYWWNGPKLSWKLTEPIHLGRELRAWRHKWIDPIIPAYAATQLKKTVKPSGGDYTSLEACMNANEQNLVTADKYFDVEIDGDWSGGADTAAVNIHNYTTDATRYINIYTTSTARHKGKYSTSYYILRKSVDAGSATLSQSVDVLYLTGLQIVRTNSNTYGGAGIYHDNRGSHNCVYDRLIIINDNGQAVYSQYDGVIQLRNSVMMNTKTSGASSRNLAQTYGAMDFYNCIGIVLNPDNTAPVFVKSAYTTYAKNCYGYTAGSGSVYSGLTLTTCASSDTSGSAGLQNVAYSTSSGAYFTNVTSGSEDFHITNTSSAFYGAGTDLSGTFTDDIDGETRSGTWDIGADEYVSASGRARRFF